MAMPAKLAVGLDLDYGFGTRLGTIGAHRVVADAGDGEGWTSGILRWALSCADSTLNVRRSTSSRPEAARFDSCSAHHAQNLKGLRDLPAARDGALSSRPTASIFQSACPSKLTERFLQQGQYLRNWSPTTLRTYRQGLNTLSAVVREDVPTKYRPKQSRFRTSDSPHNRRRHRFTPHISGSRPSWPR